MPSAGTMAVPGVSLAPTTKPATTPAKSHPSWITSVPCAWPPGATEAMVGVGKVLRDPMRETEAPTERHPRPGCEEVDGLGTPALDKERMEKKGGGIEREGGPRMEVKGVDNGREKEGQEWRRAKKGSTSIRDDKKREIKRTRRATQA